MEKLFLIYFLLYFSMGQEAASTDQFEKKKTGGLPAVLRSEGGSLLRGDCGDARTANNGVVVERQLGPPRREWGQLPTRGSGRL